MRVELDALTEFRIMLLVAVMMYKMVLPILMLMCNYTLDIIPSLPHWAKLLILLLYAFLVKCAINHAERKAKKGAKGNCGLELTYDQFADNF